MTTSGRKSFFILSPEGIAIRIVKAITLPGVSHNGFKVSNSPRVLVFFVRPRGRHRRWRLMSSLAGAEADDFFEFDDEAGGETDGADVEP